MRFWSTVLISFLLCSLSALSWGEQIEYEKGEKIKVSPTLLHPTQFLFSELEVNFKIKELKEIMTEEGEEGVVEFLKDHRGQVVVGPQNKMWIVDGHHLALALDVLRKRDDRFKSINVYLKILHEWNELSPKEFEKAMKLGNKHGEDGDYPLVYLKDNRGREQSFGKLPKKLSSMKDSPYRSLVWLLKEVNAIEELKEVPYQEFIVAEYLQKHIKLPSKMTKKAYDQALNQALDLIRDSDEDAFPGYKKVGQNSCARMMKKIHQESMKFNSKETE